MKIIITEKQAEKLISKKIKCKCGHSWIKENMDKNPYLCHMCGWEQNKEKYDDEKLIIFWKNYKK